MKGVQYREPSVGSLSTEPDRPQRTVTNLSSNTTTNPEKKKYLGMGNYTPPPQKPNATSDWGAMFSSGFTTLSSVASDAAAFTGQYAKVSLTFYFSYFIILISSLIDCSRKIF